MSNELDQPLIEALQGACLLEAMARKPGNVHPQAAFPDLTFLHFQRAAFVTAPILSQAGECGVGCAVRRAVEATQHVAPGNPNLGILLLLSPLAAVPARQKVREGIHAVLENLTVEDAREVYAAIRLACPAGLGTVDSQDVAQAPTGTLLEVMRMAADRDRVARQYACEFADILDFALPRLCRWSDFDSQWETAIIDLHLELLAEFPDSLIARKCGAAVAAEASRRARAVLDSGWPEGPEGSRALAEFDDWLRADGHRRNPGTTADLIAATLFVARRERMLPPISGTAGGIHESGSNEGSTLRARFG